MPDSLQREKLYEDLASVSTQEVATCSSKPLAVEMVENVGQLKSLRDAWDELLSESAADNMFLTWEWMYTWWKHLGAPRKLHVLIVRRESRLIAIAPFAVRPPQPWRLSPFDALEFLGMGSVGSDYLDLIVRRNEESAALAALADYLSGQRLMFELKRVLTGSTATSRLAARFEKRGWSSDTSVTETCPYIRLQGHTWESYLASLGSSHRQNLRRCLRRIEKAFTLDFLEVKTEEQRHECLKLFEVLHHKCWDTRQGSNALDSEAVMRFHEEFSSLALQRGWLRLLLLRLNGQPAASIYGFRYRDVFYYYQAGYDPQFSRYSVGLVAMGLSIRSAIDQDICEYDLLHGVESYKYLWAGNERSLNMLSCYPPGMYGSMARRTHRVRGSIKQALSHLQKHMKKS